MTEARVLTFKLQCETCHMIHHNLSGAEVYKKFIGHLLESDCTKVTIEVEN